MLEDAARNVPGENMADADERNQAARGQDDMLQPADLQGDVDDLDEDLLFESSHELPEQSAAQFVRRVRLLNATSVTSQVSRSVFKIAKQRGAKIIFDRK